MIFAVLLLRIINGALIDSITWNSPLVFSGTCTRSDLSGKCAELDVWYFYKGAREPVNSAIWEKSQQWSLEKSYTVRSLDFGSNIIRKGQTRIFFGEVSDDVLKVKADSSNVFMENLDRVASVAKFQELNPTSTEKEAAKNGFNIKIQNQNTNEEEAKKCEYKWSSWTECECSSIEQRRYGSLISTKNNDCPNPHHQIRKCVDTDSCEASGDETEGSADVHDSMTDDEDLSNFYQNDESIQTVSETEFDAAYF